MLLLSIGVLGRISGLIQSVDIFYDPHSQLEKDKTEFGQLIMGMVFPYPLTKQDPSLAFFR